MPQLGSEEGNRLLEGAREIAAPRVRCQLRRFAAAQRLAEAEHVGDDSGDQSPGEQLRRGLQRTLRSPSRRSLLLSSTAAVADVERVRTDGIDSTERALVEPHRELLLTRGLPGLIGMEEMFYGEE